jgi:hypothetical protein
MKRMIFAAWIATSLFFSGAAIGQPCTTRSCAPVPALGLAGQVAIVPSEQLVTPRSGSVDPRGCVGFPRRAPTSLQDYVAPLSLVTSELPHWA